MVDGWGWHASQHLRWTNVQAKSLVTPGSRMKYLKYLLYEVCCLRGMKLMTSSAGVFWCSFPINFIFTDDPADSEVAGNFHTGSELFSSIILSTFFYKPSWQARQDQKSSENFSQQWFGTPVACLPEILSASLRYCSVRQTFYILESIQQDHSTVM